MSTEAYKIQIDYTKDIVRVKNSESSDGHIQLQFSRLIQGLKEVGYQIKEPPSLLYHQVKEYILSTWSKGCIRVDNGTRLDATNGHYRVYLYAELYSTHFLSVQVNSKPVFDGYIRNIDDFNMLMELTSVQKP